MNSQRNSSDDENHGSETNNTAKGQLYLLDLPDELLDQIFRRYFEGLSLVLLHCGLNDRLEPFIGECDTSKVLCTGMPSLLVEQTCRRLREISISIRAKYFDGTVLIAAANFRNLQPFCSPHQFEWLRQRLIKIKINPGTTADHDILCYQRPSPIWELLVNSSPLLKVFEFYSDFYLPFKNDLREADFPTTREEHLAFVSDAVQLKFDCNTDAQMGNNTMFDLGKAFEQAGREDFVVRYIQRQYYSDNASGGEYELVISSRVDGTGRWHEWMTCMSQFAVAFYQCPMLSPMTARVAPTEESRQILLWLRDLADSYRNRLTQK